MDCVHALRVDMAKELLEKDNHVVGMVGFEVGYEDPASFRRIFKRRGRNDTGRRSMRCRTSSVWPRHEAISRLKHPGQGRRIAAGIGPYFRAGLLRYHTTWGDSRR
jgi:hypothetical protein